MERIQKGDNVWYRFVKGYDEIKVTAPVKFVEMNKIIEVDLDRFIRPQMIFDLSECINCDIIFINADSFTFKGIRKSRVKLLGCSDGFLYLVDSDLSLITSIGLELLYVENCDNSFDYEEGLKNVNVIGRNELSDTIAVNKLTITETNLPIRNANISILVIIGGKLRIGDIECDNLEYLELTGVEVYKGALEHPLLLKRISFNNCTFPYGIPDELVRFNRIMFNR